MLNQKYQSLLLTTRQFVYIQSKQSECQYLLSKNAISKASLKVLEVNIHV